MVFAITILQAKDLGSGMRLISIDTKLNTYIANIGSNIIVDRFYLLPWTVQSCCKPSCFFPNGFIWLHGFPGQFRIPGCYFIPTGNTGYRNAGCNFLQGWSIMLFVYSGQIFQFPSIDLSSIFFFNYRKIGEILLFYFKESAGREFQLIDSSFYRIILLKQIA